MKPSDQDLFIDLYDPRLKFDHPVGAGAEKFWILANPEGSPAAMGKKSEFIVLFSTKKLAQDFMKLNGRFFPFKGFTPRCFPLSALLAKYQKYCAHLILDWGGPRLGFRQAHGLPEGCDKRIGGCYPFR